MLFRDERTADFSFFYEDLMFLTTLGCFSQLLVTFLKFFYLILLPKTDRAMDESSIKNNINTYRKSKDLTQLQTARALNISTNAYRKIEKGNTAIINAHVRDFAELVGLSIEELFLGYSPSDTLNTTLQEARAEYGNKEAILKNQIDHLEKRIESLKETIASKDEIINMLKKLLAEQK